MGKSKKGMSLCSGSLSRIEGKKKSSQDLSGLLCLFFISLADS